MQRLVVALIVFSTALALVAEASKLPSKKIKKTQRTGKPLVDEPQLEASASEYAGFDHYADSESYHEPKKQHYYPQPIHYAPQVHNYYAAPVKHYAPPIHHYAPVKKGAERKHHDSGYEAYGYNTYNKYLTKKQPSYDEGYGHGGYYGKKEHGYGYESKKSDDGFNKYAHNSYDSYRPLYAKIEVKSYAEHYPQKKYFSYGGYENHNSYNKKPYEHYEHDAGYKSYGPHHQPEYKKYEEFSYKPHYAGYAGPKYGENHYSPKHEEGYYEGPKYRAYSPKHEDSYYGKPYVNNYGYGNQYHDGGYGKGGYDK